jgi:hypothetical protein
MCGLSLSLKANLSESERSGRGDYVILTFFSTNDIGTTWKVFVNHSLVRHNGLY